ncbi:MAG: hypothetical protein NTX66_01340, partial [Candidatus Falkowbacteria bacterium]|nr:hypothetical protein [Candidatus Falkowbacteria bacterium]
GAVIDDKLKDQIKITVVATGFDGKGKSLKSEINKVYTPNTFMEKELEKETASEDKGKLSIFKNIQSRPMIEKKPEKKKDEDDDLSVPAFIRKKMM